MNFITVLHPKGWIAPVRYMYSLYNTMRRNKKRYIKC